MEGITDAQIKRLTARYRSFAKEPVTVEIIGTVLYVFGTELACLRIFHEEKKGRVLYSENLKTWAYAVEPETTKPREMFSRKSKR